MFHRRLWCLSSALLALFAIVWGQTGPSPTDDSNYSVQTGEFRYLPSYVAQEPELPYGMVSGRATLVRNAKGSGSSHANIGVWIEVLPSDFDTLVPDRTFTAILHSRNCEEGGGARHQDVYNCASDGGFTEGCDADDIAAHDAVNPVPLELRINAVVSEFTGSLTGKTFVRVIGEFDWDVHIPAQFSGQTIDQLSMILYDPRRDIPMQCANLEVDRQLDGIVFFVNQFLVENVPSVSDATMIRSEVGTTAISLAVANLRTNSYYPAELKSLPCLAADPTEGGGQALPYMRDSSCVNREGTAGCSVNRPANVIALDLVTTSSSSASTTVELDSLVRSDGLSIVLMDCLTSGGDPDPTGTCAGGTPALMCIDFMNEIPQVASSSSTQIFVLSTTLEPVVTTTTVTTETTTTRTTRTGTTTTATGTTVTGTTATNTKTTTTKSTTTKTTITTTTQITVDLIIPGLDFGTSGLDSNTVTYVISLVKSALLSEVSSLSQANVDGFTYTVSLVLDTSGAITVRITVNTQQQSAAISAASAEIIASVQSSFTTTTTLVPDTTTDPAQNRQTEEPTLPPVDRNPCGKIKYRYSQDDDMMTSSYRSSRKSSSKKYKKGKKKDYSYTQLDFEDQGDIGFCCLDPNGPSANLLGFYPQRAKSGMPRSTLVAVLAGVSGSVMVSLALASYVRRRYAQESELRRVASSYAIPSLSH